MTGEGLRAEPGGSSSARQDDIMIASKAKFRMAYKGGEILWLFG